MEWGFFYQRYHMNSDDFKSKNDGHNVFSQIEVQGIVAEITQQLYRKMENKGSKIHT